MSLLLGHLTQLLIALALEGTNTTPCDNKSLLCVGGDSGQMNFSQVDRGLDLSWSLLGAWDLDAHMQFKAPVPDQGTSPCFFWQRERQDQRFAPLPMAKTTRPGSLQTA